LSTLGASANDADRGRCFLTGAVGGAKLWSLFNI
jgi:hypothetical protein